MKIRNGCVLPAMAMMMLAGMAGVADAQNQGKPPAPTPPPAAASAAAAAQPAAVPANPAEAKVVLDKARAAYKAANTYQDRVKLKFQLKAKDADGNEQNQEETEELTFVFAGPKKFALTHSTFRVHSDGTTQTAYLKPQSEYVQAPAEEALMDEVTAGPLGALAMVHVPASLKMSPAKFEKDFPLLSEVIGVKAEEREGKSGKRVWGKGELPGMVTEEKLAITMWFADDSGLLGEVVIDVKAMMDPQLVIEQATATVSFADIEVNAEIPADKLVFKPADGDKKVKSFDPQRAMLGEASPDFKGVDLEGKPLNLSDFKGKVVLLDFWATWCGPCMQVIPKIQEIAAEYADKGVVVIGMNQDDEESKEKVKGMVAAKKLTFHQFMDTTQAVAEQFKVDGIPCTVLIDGKGVVQWIHTGGSPGLKKEIVEKLDTLLKGESLVKNATPAK